MFSTTELLKLIGYFIIVSRSVKVTTGSDEEDNSLKQALFLVELLKSDLGQALRVNKEVASINVTSNEDLSNSTCPMPLDAFNNASTAVNEPQTTVTLTTPTPSSSTVPTLPSSTQPTPPPTPSPILVTTPGIPLMQFSNWPPLPGYPQPLGPGRRNFPEENLRFPYRFNRRRMMPDYYYFDYPDKNQGAFRRLGGIPKGPTGDFVNATASSQWPTTSSIVTSSDTSASTTLHVATTTTTTISSSTIPQTSNIPTTKQAIQLTTKLSIQTTPRQTVHPENQKTDNKTIKMSTHKKKKKKHRNKVKNRVKLLKAIAAIRKIKESVKEHSHNASRHHLDHPDTTTKLYTTVGDLEMSQAARELKKELESSEEGPKFTLANKDQITSRPLIKKKVPIPTLKIFLKGSSRLPIPLPENNAFCHFHPENGLCGTS